MDILNGFIKLFDEICEWITSKFNTEPEIQTLLPKHIYDIYYHFMLLKKEGEMKNIHIGNLEIDSFNMKLDNTPYTIKIYKENNTIYTNLYYELDGIFDIVKHKNFCTIHNTYESIEEEIEAISDFLDVNDFVLISIGE